MFMDIKRYIKLPLILIGVSLIAAFNAHETPVPIIKKANEGGEISAHSGKKN